MSAKTLDRKVRKALEEILGYINFSSGASDANFLRSLNYVFGRIESSPQRTEPAWRVLARQLRDHLEMLRETAEPFHRSQQADAVLKLVFDHFLPAYRTHHRDLLFHQTEESLFRPLFIGRVIEAALRQGSHWDQPEAATAAMLREVNDYVGYRPVPVLESEQKCQPYEHEWVRPIPLFIRGVGVGVGRYADLVRQALEVLEQTDPDILQQAYFEVNLLDELAMDPRAYDFEHPVSKRPNDVYGEWDPRQLDLSGYSRRFVVRQVILDAILQRVEKRGRLAYQEALFEGGAVLAGTMLMGSGVSGNPPDCHDSTVSLAALVQKIAAYRDDFYDRLLGRLEGRRRQRLVAEAARLKQPFGGTRQHVNQYIARLRAEQSQHFHLAEVYARLGASEEAMRQADKVRTASARMGCQILCRLSAGGKALADGDLHTAAALLPELEDLLHRAIDCGAMADPWCILGFAGQYPLFRSSIESVHDDRVDKLIAVLDEIFNLYTLLQKEAAVRGEDLLQQQVANRMRMLAQWWDKYATTEISEVDSFSGLEVQQSAEQVADAVRAWRQAGAAAGDVAFWRQHAVRFSSQTSYALVVETLLEHGDLVAAMALLVHWVSQAATGGLKKYGYTLSTLCEQWMTDLWRPGSSDKAKDAEMSVGQRWALARKFIDYLEANADVLAKVPRFALANAQPGPEQADHYSPQTDDYETPVSAAYEGVTYRDGADDGFDEAVFEAAGDAVGLEMVHEAERIVEHLEFLVMLAELRHAAAMASFRPELADPQREEVIADWARQTEQQYRQLLELVMAIANYRIPRPRGTFESLMEYDRRRSIKDTLLEQVVQACVELADTLRMLRASISQTPSLAGLSSWEEPLGRVLRGILQQDVDAIRRCWDELLMSIRKHPFQYLSLWKGGNPLQVVATQGLIRAMRRLLAYLPRLGLLRHTLHLLETIEEMEIENPIGPGAITEFDQVFEEACRALVRCVAVSAESWTSLLGRRQDNQLVAVLDNLLELLHYRWSFHCSNVRLSVLETVVDQRRWRTLGRFIKTYGGDLFTQQFMQLAHLRAILHQGVDSWLQTLAQDPEAAENIRLLRDLNEGRISRRQAARWLTLILEAIAENYLEYADYNSTTTQSDRGEMLYTLLDFLRLAVAYRRMEWHLRPVIVAHEVLLRCGCDRAAETLYQAVAERSAPMADMLLEQYHILEQMHAMHLRSVADRVEQRFLRPLEINQLRALVHGAAEEFREDKPGEKFARLQAHIAPLLEAVSGSGYELPSWLEALREEAARCQEEFADQRSDEPNVLDPLLELPQTRLSLAQIRKELRAAWPPYYNGGRKA